MRTLKRVFLLVPGAVTVFAGLVVIFLHARTEQPPEPLYPTSSVVLDTGYATPGAYALQELVDARNRRHFPSVSLAVGVNGALVWAGTVGYENVAQGIPASPETRYHVASVAKSFTSFALGTLVQDGVIELDVPFGLLVPDFGGGQHTFTVGQLQTHRAGVRHHRSVFEAFNRKDFDSVRAAAARIEGDSLLFEPGTGTSYSTPAYSLLALAMERAANEDYLSLVDRLVLTPAGMTRTFADSARRPTSAVAVPYVVHGDRLVRGPAVNYSDRWAGGGFFSTPSDLVRYGNAILSGSGMSAEWWALSVGGTGTPEGFPRLLGESEYDRGRRLSIGGSGWGGRAALNVYPHLQVVVAIATNSRPSDNLGPGLDLDAIAHRFAGSD